MLDVVCNKIFSCDKQLVANIVVKQCNVILYIDRKIEYFNR